MRKLLELGTISDRVLEIGCANGWRLNSLKHTPTWSKTSFVGIDPSKEAIESGSKEFLGIQLLQGVADALPMEDSSVDILVYGFCLYLCDPSDYFRITTEANRVVREGGMVVIFDFFAETPYRNKYGHAENMYSHKMNFSRLFTASPCYQLMLEDFSYMGDQINPDNKLVVHMLRKNSAAAWE